MENPYLPNLKEQRTSHNKKGKSSYSTSKRQNHYLYNIFPSYFPKNLTLYRKEESPYKKPPQQSSGRTLRVSQDTNRGYTTEPPEDNSSLPNIDQEQKSPEEKKQQSGELEGNQSTVEKP